MSEVMRNEGWLDLLTAPTRERLYRDLRRGARRGEFATVGAVTHVAPGLWAVKVVRVAEAPPPLPRWVKPAAVVGGGLVTVGSLGALGFYLVSALVAAVAGAVSVGGVLVVGSLAWLASRALSGGSCSTTVTVTHRR